MKPALLVAYAACLIWLTFVRNAVWRTDISIWQDVVSKSPMNHRAWSNLASGYMKANQREKAVLSLRRALSIYPEAGNFLLLGDLLAEARVSNGALRAYEEALSRAARDPLSAYDKTVVARKAYMGMGYLACEANDFRQAERHFRNAVETDRSFGPAWNNLGYSLLKQGRCEEAARALRIALELDPHDSLAAENLDLAGRCAR